MEMDELVREFKKFLKERNLLEAFLNGVLRKYENLYTSSDPIRDFCFYRPTVVTNGLTMDCLESPGSR